jgi:hypothetical protein
MAGESGPVPSTNVSVSSVQQIVSGTSGYQIGLSWLNDNDGFVGPVVGNRVANIGRARGHYLYFS